MIELQEQNTQNSQVYHSFDLLLDVEEDEEKNSKVLYFPPSRGYKLRNKEEELVPLCIIDGVEQVVIFYLFT